MNTPSVVVFDLGKVLVDFNYGLAIERVATASKKPLEHVSKVVGLTPLLFQLETGLITDEQFFAEIERETGFPHGFEQFSGMFADIFSEIEPMIALQAKLKNAGIPTWIFSNTNGIAVRHIQKRFPFFANFTGYVYSYEQGSMKPDAKIYEVIEQQTGHRGGDIVYLDDRAENIAAGAARGWRTILHSDPVETRQILLGMGLPV